MICSYIRSSSYNNYDFCQVQYYLNYVLGIERKTGKKATKGTMVHKVLECLANIKLQLQNTNDNNLIFKDDTVGKLDIYRYDLLEPHKLTNSEVEAINKTRINKWNYPENCKLSYKHTRYGVEIVEKLIDKVYHYYKENTDHLWQPVDFKDVTNWAWMALDYKRGMFDPRRKHIVKPEMKFDIMFDEPWAKYDFTINNKRFSGNLALKGTIDLISRVGDGIIEGSPLEILDYKTGQRKNWATGQKKDYRSLSKDPQLMMYHLAAKHLFPDEDILTSIFWVRDGGPFTFSFDEETIEKTKQLLAKRFKEICDCTKPTMIDPLQQSFKCTKICDYYKMKSPDKKKNMCQFIHDSIHEVGIDIVTEQYNQGTFNQYEAPGEI